MKNEKYHIPVLLNKSIQALNIKDNGVYVDATLGGGGHSKAILESNDTIRLFSFDRDSEAINYAEKLLNDFGKRSILIHSNYDKLRTKMSLEKVKKIDGILFDLGVSFHQITDPQRGFSFSKNGKLDMRMDNRDNVTAYEIVNEFSVEELSSIFLEYGEEKKARTIAKRIALKREIKKIETTAELSLIIDEVIKGKMRVKSKARIFQALRIFINGELDSIKTAIKEAVDILKPNGRLVVITYHSLEDRIIKQFFKYEEKSCICPSNFPVCICDKKSRLKIVNKKPIIPTEDEIETNPQSRSAKLRIAEKV
jgi:16S rRNA (cytosine1402-N4)-methyltransferase